MDSQRRKTVMQRSIKLGHCVCDPKKPCPCPVFLDNNVCLCAGEKLEAATKAVRLTRLIEKAGCASKIDQAFLKQALANLPSFEHQNVLVGVPAGDDAGVYDMANGKALVQTVDVFMPSVDDPYDFGQITAANSLSDIYAMGAEPITALSVIGFPVGRVPDSVFSDILKGGIDKMAEAGVPVIGGHSINDRDIKAGFAVTGLVEKEKIVTNSSARPGDFLILTKPLGIGIIAFAGQIDRASPENLSAARDSMTALNKTASRLMVKYNAHAATDVTGFSLMGHLAEMAFSSKVDAEIIWDELPLLPGVIEYVASGILPGAIERNKESCTGRVVISKNVPEPIADMCYDAQTSGGLLIAVAGDKASPILKDLYSHGINQAAVIGQIRSKGTGKVCIETNGKRTFPLSQ